MVKGNFIEVVNSLEAINSRCFKLSEMGSTIDINEVRICNPTIDSVLFDGE